VSPSSEGRPALAATAVAGQALSRANEMTSTEHARGHFSEKLHKNILSIFAPGATLLMTCDSLQSVGTGTRLIVITTGGRDPK
jgi:hypothetical protein